MKGKFLCIFLVLALLSALFVVPASALTVLKDYQNRYKLASLYQSLSQLPYSTSSKIWCFMDKANTLSATKSLEFCFSNTLDLFNYSLGTASPGSGVDITQFFDELNATSNDWQNYVGTSTVEGGGALTIYSNSPILRRVNTGSWSQVGQKVTKTYHKADDPDNYIRIQYYYYSTSVSDYKYGYHNFVDFDYMTGQYSLYTGNLNQYCYFPDGAEEATLQAINTIAPMIENIELQLHNLYYDFLDYLSKIYNVNSSTYNFLKGNLFTVIQNIDTNTSLILDQAYSLYDLLYDYIHNMQPQNGAGAEVDTTQHQDVINGAYDKEDGKITLPDAQQLTAGVGAFTSIFNGIDSALGGWLTIGLTFVLVLGFIAFVLGRRNNKG